MKKTLLPALLVVTPAVLVLALGPSPAVAQTSPFLPDHAHRALVNEISGDRAFEHVRELTRYHRTGPGQDFWKAVEYIRSAADDAGLEDVEVIRQDWSGRPWTCRSAEAWLLGPEPTKVADFHEVAVSVADMSRTTHVGGGAGRRGIRGRRGGLRGRGGRRTGRPHLGQPRHRDARGGLEAGGPGGGVPTRPTGSSPSTPRTRWRGPASPTRRRGWRGVEDGTPGTFAIMVSPRRGHWIRERLARSPAPPEMRVDIEADFDTKREQGMVEAWIRGREIHDQQIVLVSHIQEEKTSANDDGSGCASMLEIGRALARLVREGTLPRPRRDIRFWWVNELSSQPQYFRDHPEAPGRMLVALNQDMVGARQSWGGRVQYGSRLPWSLPHPLEDVMESVLTTIRDGNTSYLANRRTGQPQPFLKEVRAVKGSREPFHARMVPYYNSTDHHSFTPRHVGVPGTSLTNWPDQWIHSSGDDLENVDATQLERNAVVVAAVALYFATLEEAEVPALAAYVAARGRSRVAADVATAVAHLSLADPAERQTAWAAAAGLVRQTHAKEERALDTLSRLDAEGRSRLIITEARDALSASRDAEARALDAAYSGLTGQSPTPPPAGETAREMARLVYTPVDDAAALSRTLRRVRGPASLHSLMKFEALNFSDGTRTAWEVYEAVAAQALSAGAWYYGTVSPGDVKAVLDSAVEAGAYKMKRR